MSGLGLERLLGLANPLLPFRERSPVGKDTGLHEVSQDLTQFLRRVYILEGKRRKIIDFDLAPPDPTDLGWGDLIIGGPTKSEWLGIINRLKELHTRMEDLPMSKNVREKSQYEYLMAKLKSHIVFYQNTALGGETPTLDLIEATLGKKPELIPEPILAAQQEIVRKLFEEVRVKNYDRESIERYRTEQTIPLDEVPEKIKSRMPQLLRGLSIFLGRKITPNISIDIVQEDDYWINWSSGTYRKFVQRVNTHRRHASRWTNGKIGAMVVHEDTGHMAQMDSWQREIDERRLLPVLGVTSVYDPEQITCEGIAQTIHHFVPEIRNLLSPHEELELELEGLRQMVYNNVHIWINSANVPDEGIIAYVHQYYPAESEDEIRRQIKDRTHDPVKSLYLYAYGIGFRLHQWYAVNLDRNQKRFFLAFIFSQPVTPKQEFDYFMQLLESKAGRRSGVIVPYNWDSPRNLPDF